MGRGYDGFGRELGAAGRKMMRFPMNWANRRAITPTLLSDCTVSLNSPSF